MTGPPAEPQPAVATTCSHCGLPLAAESERATESGPRFCCAGCETVYQLLHEEGLQGYYDLAARVGAPRGVRPRIRGGHFETFDEEEFLAENATPLAGGRLATEFLLEGLHCSACVWLLEGLPSRLKGLDEARVSLAENTLRVVWDPAQIQLSEIARFVDRLGYGPHPRRGASVRQVRRIERRRLLARIAVAGAAAGNAMLLAAALYGGWFSGMQPEFRRFFRWTSMVVTLPAVLWAAAPFFRGARSSLTLRRLHMDVPIALGVAAGLTGGLINTILGRGEIYFDSVASLVFLLLIGRWLQEKSKDPLIDGVDGLLDLLPRQARLVEGASMREVAPSRLVEGDVVEILPGEVVPADGVVIEGESALDQAFLTGEPQPAPVQPGTTVYAGSANLLAPLRVRVQASGEATRLGRLVELVREHAAGQPPIVQLADRLAAHFVALLLTLAALTLLFWWPQGPAVAFEHTLALLVVACPCALGLATPLTVTAALSQAARRGVLVKGGAPLEALAGRGRIWLDKTGTVTEGRFELLDSAAGPGVAAVVGAIERRVVHPIAQVLTEWADQQAVEPAPRPSELRQIPGRGVEARVEGRLWRLGAPEWALEDPRQAQGLAPAGASLVVFACEGELAGWAALGDALRPEARRTVHSLQRRGWTVGLLSGDRSDVVQAVAADLGVAARDAIGGATPEEKVRIVEASRAQGDVVVMVGDGVNDAAALAAATVGIALQGGAEIALEGADAFLGRAGITALADLVEAGRRTVGRVRRILVLSLAYNLVGASLAIAGWIHPLAAALLMSASSITAVTASFRPGLYHLE